MSRKNGAAASAETENALLENLSFEAAMEELEGVTARLESGGIALEDMLQLTRRGLTLANLCDAKLDGAEQILEQLTASAQGELIAEPFAWGSDEEEDES